MASPRLFVAVALISFAALPRAGAQGVIAGTVREDSTGKPLAGVEIIVEGEKQPAHTDGAGRYAIALGSGMHVANFRMAGYQPFKLRVIVRKDTANGDVDLVLATHVQQLAGVNVNAATHAAGMGRDGFEYRRSQGLGKFIDSAQMRARDDRGFSDVLRELTGVKLVQTSDMSGHTGLYAVSPIRESPPPSPLANGMKLPTLPQCYASVYFDGTALYRSGSADPIVDFSREFNVASLESVEYYKSAAETPPQYSGGDGNCGVLVLWPRRK